ncbi:MAG: hypothetical protein ACRD1L_03460 [Terriglobales bacterium]
MRPLLYALFCAAAALGQTSLPLQQVGVVPLAGVKGRIDHMSLDVKNRRLFICALGNDTVEVVGLKTAKRIHSITGLSEPQGVIYVARSNRLYVANGGDGTLRIFDGGSFKLLRTVAYGDDADNVRFDLERKRVYVGYGDGALGVIDLDGTKVANIRLDAHPESFQIENSGRRIFVNLPGSRKIVVIGQAKGLVEATWRTGGAFANFPMALDEAEQRLFVVCRSPAEMIVFNTASGAIVASLPAVGDSDDVFYDPVRKRIYATGGAGAVWVYQERDSDHYQAIGRIPTVEGARTGFYSPELDRLFVAVRQLGDRPAEIRIYEPR